MMRKNTRGIEKGKREKKDTGREVNEKKTKGEGKRI